MGIIRFIIRYGGTWTADESNYVGGYIELMAVDEKYTYDEFIKDVIELMDVDVMKFAIVAKCLFKLAVSSPAWEIKNDRHLKLYLMHPDVFSHPVCITLNAIRENKPAIEMKSVSVSKKVGKSPLNVQSQDINPSQPSNMHSHIPATVYEQLVKFKKACQVANKLSTSKMEDGVEGCEFDNTEGYEFDNIEGNEFDNTEGNEFDNIEGNEFDNTEGDQFDHIEGYDFDNTERYEFDSNLPVDFTEFIPGGVTMDDKEANVQLPDLKGKKPMASESQSRCIDIKFNDSCSGIMTGSSKLDVDIGQIYISKKELSLKLSKMAMKNNFEFRVTKSNKGYFGVECIDSQCKWRLRASNIKGTELFRVLKYNNVHTCSKEILNHDHRHARSWVIGDIIKSKYEGASRQYRPNDIIQDMRQNYGVNISYEKAWRARENAYVLVRGSPDDSYNQLGRYCEMMKLRNPGTVCRIELEEDQHFRYFFMALGLCIKGFLNCIRPVIVVDGTFLKGKYRGTLLVTARA